MKTIRTEIERMTLVREISTLKLPFGAEIEPDARSLDQNALSHRWYGQIAKAGEYDTVGARRFCKLHFGVPIMRAGETKLCENFRAGWDSLIKTRMTYPEKLGLMDWWPVTSLMDWKQMREFLTAIQTHFVEKGLILTGRDMGWDQLPEARRA